MVFEAAEELYRSGSPIDVITVKNKLEEKGQFEQIGGLPFLANLSSAVGSSVNVRHYAAIVEEKSVLRRLIRTAGDISQLSYEAKRMSMPLWMRRKKAFLISCRSAIPSSSIISEISRSARLKNRGYLPFQGQADRRADGLSGFDAKTAGLQNRI